MDMSLLVLTLVLLNPDDCLSIYQYMYKSKKFILIAKKYICIILEKVVLFDFQIFIQIVDEKTL